MSQPRGRGSGQRGGGPGGGRGGSYGGERGGRGGGRGGGDGGRGGFWAGQGGGRGRGGGGERGGFSGRGRGGGDGYRGGGGGRGGRGGHGGDSGPAVFQPSTGVPSPDPNVTRVENTLGSNLDVGALTLQTAMPNRPAFGKLGTPLTLWANYVQLTTARDLVFFRYDLSVQPAATGKKLTQIIRLLLETPEFAPYRRDAVTDFKSTCVTRKRLPQDDWTIPVPYRSEGEDEPRPGGTTYMVRVLYTNTLNVSDLTRYIESTDLAASCDDKLPLIQAFNILLNHYAKSSADIRSVGSSRAFPLRVPEGGKSDLGNGLAAVRGFFTSVRAATCRILVNVNVTCGSFYNDGPLEGLMQAYGQGNKYKLATFLQRVRVRTTHLPEHRNRAGEVVIKAKTIVGLATPNDGYGLEHPPRVAHYGAGPKQVEFWLAENAPTSVKPVPGADPASGGQGKKKKGGKKGGAAGPLPPPTGGRYISVYDFFWNRYNIQVRPDLPVVNVGTRQNPTYLPAEVCVVLPGLVANRKLDPGQTAEMIRFAVRKPGQNATYIKQFGVDVKPGLITVPGRVLNAPTVFYQDQKAAQVRFGSWNMINVKFTKNGKLADKRWSYLMVSLYNYNPGWRDAFRDDASLADAVSQFRAALIKTGMTVGEPAPGRTIRLNRPDDPALEELIKMASKNLDLLLIIIPDKISELYSSIKHCGDVKYGVRTVCCVGKSFAKRNDQYYANVALKVNLKMGGDNQLLEPSRRALIDEDKTMVVGVDVTHPSPGSAANAPSIAGMVASVDKLLGQWPAVLRVQRRARNEMVSDLGDMLKTRLALWKNHHKGALPENILIYRDGVSEGQYQTVLDSEVPLLRKACEEVYPAADTKRGLPRLTVVIVGKRHHTRFYVTKPEDADRSGNAPPGTVVDRGVTEARQWDFFLQAHAAIQGTARPAHYVVVLDEILRAKYGARGAKLPKDCHSVADVLEQLTQSMCYVYGRATKAVSVCTPAYYADVVCERARCYLSGVFDTPSQSAAGSVTGSVATMGLAATNEDVRIHERVKDTMFYI
ncbi:hypothetical protein VTJ49DRAFT_3281 [Mycothermus thermophilus]|uniref:Piwi domain-containing protein n=1 Tax=Humicola insolens TaxID=85995 RepID=A0ABR3V8D0_HUMIN